MHYTLRKSAALLLACGAVATSAVGQAVWPAATHGSLDGLAWPPTWPAPGTFKRSRIGEFTGDARSDVVTLAGYKLVLLSDVLESGTHYALGAIATLDFDVLAGGGVDGRDAVAATSSAGLSVIENIPGAPIDFGSTLIATGGWMGAARVICGDINYGGHGDFVGLQSNLQTLLVRIAESGRQLPIGSSETVVDLALLHWGNAAELALAVLTPTKVVVYDAFGTDFSTQLASLPVSGGYSMAIVPQHEGTIGNSDHIAVLRQVASPPVPSTELRVFSMGGSYTNLTIQSAQCISVSAGDMDDDGKGDLIIAYPGSFVPFHLRNTGTTTPQFVAPANWGESIDVNDPILETAYSSNNVARLAVGDVDHDDRADLVIPMQQTGMWPGQSPGHACLTYAYAQQSVIEFWREGWLNDYSAGHVTGWICFNRGVIGSANGVSLSIWPQLGQGAFLEDGPLPYMPYQGYFVFPSNLDNQVVGLPIDFHVPAACFQSGSSPREMYWIEMKPVLLENFNTPLNVLTEFPRRLALIASDRTDVCDYMFDPGQPVVTMLYEVSHGGAPYDHSGYGGPDAGTCGDWDPCDNSPAATTEMPVLVKRRRIPQHSPGSTPPQPSITATPTEVIRYDH